MNMRPDPAVVNEHAAELTASVEPIVRPPEQPLNLDAAIFRDVQVSLRVKLGEATLKIEDLLTLKSGSLLKLDRQLNEPVELYLNDALIGRGEIVAVDDCFGLRVVEIGAR